MTDRPAAESPGGARPAVEFDAANLIVRLDMEIRGEASAISPAVERVLAVTSGLGCARGKEFEVETALREALGNAVRYGCAHNPGATVQLSVACDQARGILVVVRDPGPGFDPSQVPSPILGEQIYSHHGRGIFLINQLMDQVEYRRNGTEIAMVKRSAPEGAAASAAPAPPAEA